MADRTPDDSIPDHRVPDILVRAAELDRDIKETSSVEALRAVAVDAGISLSSLEAALGAAPTVERRCAAGDAGVRAVHAAGGRGLYAGALKLRPWFDRNLRIVQNFFRVLEPGDDRLFMVMGYSHVPVLRQILDLTPQLCAVDVLPWLE